MTERNQALDELWSRYAETVLHFQGEPEVTVDLRMEVTPSVRKGLAALGLSGEFGVLTAFNPRGDNVSQAGNNRRMKEFEAELESAGYDFVRIDACSPDKSHCECSVALSASRDDAIGIAKRWEQIAIFWFDGSTFWIHGAITEREPVHLPLS
jgi:hypothetical protein